MGRKAREQVWERSETQAIGGTNLWNALLTLSRRCGVSVAGMRPWNVWINRTGGWGWVVVFSGVNRRVSGVKGRRSVEPAEKHRRTNLLHVPFRHTTDEFGSIASRDGRAAVVQTVGALIEDVGRQRSWRNDPASVFDVAYDGYCVQRT